MAQVIFIYAPSNFSSPKVYLPIRQLATLSQILTEHKVSNLIYDFGCISAYKQYYSTQIKDAKKRHSIGNFLNSLLGKRLRYKPTVDEYVEWIINSIEITSHTKCLVFWIENRNDLQLARNIVSSIRRKNSSCHFTIVAMGDYIKFTGPYILQYAQEFDCFILNHWENSIIPLWETITTGKNLSIVPNSAIYSGGFISTGPVQRILSLDDLLIPTYDNYRGFCSNEKIKIFTIEHSRDGFISYAEPMSLRSKITTTPAKMLEEIAYLRKKYKSLCFHLVGEATTSSEVQLFNLNLLKAPYHIYYTRDFNCLEIEGDLVHTIAISGGKGISVKIPTGSQRLLSNFYGIMRTISSFEGAFSAFSTSPIYTAIECNYPSPDDDRHTFAETLRLFQRVKPDSVKVSPVWLWPDSPWWENRSALGFDLDTDEYLKWLAGNPSNIDYTMWRPYSPKIMEEEISKLKISCRGDVTIALIGAVLQITKNQKGLMQVLEEAFLGSEPEILEDMIIQFNTRMEKKVISEDWNAQKTANFRAVAN